jgi:hypothetical protein
MAKLKLKNGTPVGNEHLCRSCVHGQFTVGYRETDVLVVCTNSSPARQIPFPVYECTEYWDRHRPSWEDMSKLALDFSEGHRKPVQGFRGNVSEPADASPDDNSDAAEEAARLK